MLNLRLQHEWPLLFRGTESSRTQRAGYITYLLHQLFSAFSPSTALSGAIRERRRSLAEQRPSGGGGESEGQGPRGQWRTRAQGTGGTRTKHHRHIDSEERETITPSFPIASVLSAVAGDASVARAENQSALKRDGLKRKTSYDVEDAMFIDFMSSL